MFFTQEDYEKIEQWLKNSSIKDSEFTEVDNIKDTDTIVVVQDGYNKKIRLKALIDQILNFGVADFVNITDKYDHTFITLEEAISKIPVKARKTGQVITFKDDNGNWRIYQFKGYLNQWNILDQWDDLFDWEKLIIDSFLPDEEDITKSEPDENGNSYLSLKDREYNPDEFSGLGRIILRKNIKEIEDKNYGTIKKNILTQDMINKPNTIYEIRYDFDLNNTTINIPKNCTLEFNGGKFQNGRTILDDTSILPYGCLIGKYFSNVEGTYRKGQCIFEDTFNKPIWFNGIKWVDATGAEV